MKNRTRSAHTWTTRGQNKGRKQQRARGRRQLGATHQMGARQILHSAWFSKHTTCLGMYHNACLKRSNFLNRNTVCPIIPTWSTMATARGQETEEKQIRHKKLEQGSKHGNHNILERVAVDRQARHQQGWILNESLRVSKDHDTEVG